VNAAGTISTATSASIAPAANAKENGRSRLTRSTSRNAPTAPTGCGALVNTAAQNCSPGVNPALSMGIATLVPSGMFCRAMARITNRPRPAVPEA
jgi:hypothetical protein